MDIIKSENGWLDVHTEICIPYGQILIDIYNEQKKLLNEIDNAIIEYFDLKSHMFHVIGVDDGDLPNSRKDIFDSNPDIVAIIIPFDNVTANRLPTEYTFSEQSFYKGKMYYIPIYKSDLGHILKDPNNYSEFFYSMKHQRKFLRLIEHLFDQEEAAFWRSKGYADYVASTKRIVASWLDPMPINTKILIYKGEFYRSYEVDDVHWLVYDDMVEMLENNYNLIDCPICKKAFLSTDKKRHFCDECSKDKKSIKYYNDQKRKHNPEYEHKKIRDMLRNHVCHSREEQCLIDNALASFSNESQYYLDIINGQDVELCENYDSTIKTVVEYKAWINKKKAEYKKMFKQIREK